VEWIKKRWGGKLILKGIMDAEDARLAVDSGADALIVSNHGGRQLDGAPSSIAALPAIVDAVGKDIEVLDGRRHPQRPGRAQGLGPGRARHADRPQPSCMAWARPAKAGVTKALQIIHKELDLTISTPKPAP
jgi:L-lactate dehydrogenase (cytochrome)